MGGYDLLVVVVVVIVFVSIHSAISNFMLGWGERASASSQFIETVVWLERGRDRAVWWDRDDEAADWGATASGGSTGAAVLRGVDFMVGCSSRQHVANKDAQAGGWVGWSGLVETRWQTCRQKSSLCTLEER